MFRFFLLILVPVLACMPKSAIPVSEAPQGVVSLSPPQAEDFVFGPGDVIDIKSDKKVADVRLATGKEDFWPAYRLKKLSESTGPQDFFEQVTQYRLEYEKDWVELTEDNKAQLQVSTFIFNS